jgi:beta-galactosidase/beta-glucuronidase
MPSLPPAITAVGPDGHGYPRPLLAREHWISLNGRWDFAFDRDAVWTSPGDVVWDQHITVPFAPETRASGIGDTSFSIACWYRRELPTLEIGPNERVILHFGAVDYRASVWANDQLATTHEGGYTPFSVDITRHFANGRTVIVTVRAEDDPWDLTKPRGKQDWQLEPHSIWYPRTTGIWQTVWLERVPETHIGTLRWTSNMDRWEIALKARLRGIQRRPLRLRVRLRVDNELLADDSYSVSAGEVHRRVALSDPGIDDFRNELLWSPSKPTLIAAELELCDEHGELVDHVFSYTALRSLATEGDRFLLNGRPFLMRLVLDQGYWPDTGQTAPDDGALRKDVELVKGMGFNGVRKHQKIEDPRFLYWSDRLGLLVWEEMPSAYRYTSDSIRRITEQWTAAMQRDYSHPCVAAWVPFNESWGVPNLPSNPAERHFVHALYHLTKTLDPTRPVIGNDGWESVATDIIGIHDYDPDPERLARRYHGEELRPRLFRHERPGGRKLMLDGDHALDHPVVLSEFGGIALSTAEKSWGYSRSSDAAALATRYSQLLDTVRSLEMLCGFCYTQFADTFQEANGLLYADRTPKFPIAAMRDATTGAGAAPATVSDSTPPEMPATSLTKDEPTSRPR